jgi:hypothetical protein
MVEPHQSPNEYTTYGQANSMTEVPPIPMGLATPWSGGTTSTSPMHTQLTGQVNSMTAVPPIPMGTTTPWSGGLMTSRLIPISCGVRVFSFRATQALHPARWQKIF